jgi:hypothetical protein
VSGILNYIQKKYRAFSYNQSNDSTGITLISRERGPICYFIKIIFEPARREALPGLLLASGLSWYWNCGSGALTRLTEQTAPAMAAALHQFAVLHQQSCALTLIGCDPQADEIASRDEFQHFEDFHEMLRTFSHLEKGPINMVLVQEGDMPYEYIFVPHTPVRQVRDLLEVWGVSEANIRRVMRDNSISGSFEKLFELPDRPG